MCWNWELLVDFVGSFKYRETSNLGTTYLSFPFCFFISFVSFFYLKCYLKFKSILNKEESKCLCIVQLSKWMFCFSRLNIILVIGLLRTAFIVFRYVRSVPNFSKPFFMRVCWTSPNVFSYIYWDGYAIFVLGGFYTVYYVNCFQTYIPGMKPNWS